MPNIPSPEFPKESSVNRGETAGTSSPHKNRLSASSINRLPGASHLVNILGAITLAIGGQALRPSEAHADTAPIMRPSSIIAPDLPLGVDAAPIADETTVANASEGAVETAPYSRGFLWVRYPSSEIPRGGLPKLQAETDHADKFMTSVADKYERIGDPELIELMNNFREQNKQHRLNEDENPPMFGELHVRASFKERLRNGDPFGIDIQFNEGKVVFVLAIDAVNLENTSYGPDSSNDIKALYVALKTQQQNYQDVKSMIENGMSIEEVKAKELEISLNNALGAIKDANTMMTRISPRLADLGLQEVASAPVVGTASGEKPDGSLWNVSAAPDSAPEHQTYKRQFDWVINQPGPGQKDRFQKETDEADRFLVGIEEKVARINNPELSAVTATFKDENKRNRLNPDETPAIVHELRLRDSSMPDTGNSTPFRYTLVANDQVGGVGGALLVTHIDVSKIRNRNEFGPDFINDVLDFYVSTKQHEGFFNEMQEMLANGVPYEEITAAKGELYAKHGAEALKSYRELMPKIIPQLANLGLKFQTTERPVISQP